MTNSYAADLFDSHATDFDPPPRKVKSRQSELGQFLTRDTVASFMAGLFPPSDQPVRLLDAGAGKGALTNAFVHHWRERGRQGRIEAEAYELDDYVLEGLEATAEALRRINDVTATIIRGDFIERGALMERQGKTPGYTHAILNPPYKKINTASQHRTCLRMIGLETVNLYSGFVGLSLALMAAGGELVAIIPRSFCNGPYYEPFRRFILSRAALQHIHLFHSRNKAFSDDGVLQENVIIRMTKGATQGDVIVSTSSDDRFADYEETHHPFARIVLPGDQNQFIHIPTDDEPQLLASPAFGFRLEDLGVSVSTGPVVDFRMREETRADPEPGTVPLLYPGHFTRDGLEWPKPGFKKPNAIRRNRVTEKWLFPAGYYALVRRFSSKEERRRIVANVLEPADLQAEKIGIENHLNVIHVQKRSLDRYVAHGIASYLNSTAVDQYFRRFNGHTQVNATDLRTLPYPSRDAVIELGKWAVANPGAPQEALDIQIARIA
jgi:adenine-specific DNA-methyltransferase